MANELRTYLDSLGLKEEAIEKAVELAVPDSFRKDLAEMGGRIKEYETELSDLRPLKDAPKRKEALKRVGVDYDAQPKSVRRTFDAIPSDKLDDLNHVAQVVQEEGIQADLSAVQEAQSQTAAEQISEATMGLGNGTPSRTTRSKEAYDAAVAAAQTPEELDKVYRDFGKESAPTT